MNKTIYMDKVRKLVNTDKSDNSSQVQEDILTAFKKHINKLIKQVKKGEYNIVLVEQLNHFIVEYYEKNADLISEYSSSSSSSSVSSKSSKKLEDDDSDSTSVSKKSDENTSTSKKSEDNESTPISKTSLKLEDSSSEEENEVDSSLKDDTLFNYFVTSDKSMRKRRLLFNPTYDIDENIITFIRNSLSY